MDSFLFQCLQKEPENRSTIEELIEHPFIKKSIEKISEAKPVGSSSLLTELVYATLDEVKEYRKLLEYPGPKETTLVQEVLRECTPFFFPEDQDDDYEADESESLLQEEEILDLNEASSETIAGPPIHRYLAGPFQFSSRRKKRASAAALKEVEEVKERERNKKLSFLRRQIMEDMEEDLEAMDEQYQQEVQKIKDLFRRSKERLLANESLL